MNTKLSYNFLSLFVLIGQLVFGQAVFLTDNGYLIPKKEDFSELEYLARVGKNCLIIQPAQLELIEQIRLAKMQSDSNSIILQKEVNSLKYKSLERESQYKGCVNRIGELELVVSKKDTDIKELNLVLKKKKLENFALKTSIGLIAVLAGYLIIK